MELKHSIALIRLPIVILLIVPYGIETFVNTAVYLVTITFNRTLWN